jgi:single-stranded-DNA-specific exonuclease
MLINKIQESVEEIKSLSKSKPIKVISHFDTDGITSAAILTRALQRTNIKFSLEILKGLEQEYIEKLSSDNILIFLDLASNSLKHLGKKDTEVFILDHHEIIETIPPNVRMINPTIYNQEPLSSSGICYLFAKTLSQNNKDLANLAVLGMVGDLLEKNLSKVYDEILKDSETTIKKGLLIYPSTRPLDRTLQYSSNPYISGVSGSYHGAINLLMQANIKKVNGKFPALYELTDDQMGSLLTAIMVKCADQEKSQEMIGNLYLINFFNKLEDAREISALINSCSRMGNHYIALGFCLGNKKCKEQAEKIYIKYKQLLVSGLKFVSESKEDKIQGKNYVIINAKNNIKDTIIGTIASIISNSPTYEKGTIIVALAYNKDKIKVSARIAGREGRNVREVLNQVVVPLKGEVGGHPKAAGCLISKENETQFLSE